MSVEITFASDLENRQQALAELTRRVAHQPFGLVGEPSFCVHLIPEAFPKDIPIPEVRRIVGGIIRPSGLLHVFADVELTPEEVVQFYTGSLPADKWTQVELHPARLGIDPGPEWSVQHLVFCMGPSGPELSITAWKQGHRLTDLRLAYMPRYHPGSMGHCTRLKHDQVRSALWNRRPFWPSILPPPDTWTPFELSDEGWSSITSPAILETNMGPADIMEYCAAQLEKSGWQRLGSVTHGGSLVTHWQSTDSLGVPVILFLQVAVPEAGRATRLLISHVVRAPDPNH